MNKAVKKAAGYITAGVSKKSYMNNEIIDLYQEDPRTSQKIIVVSVNQTVICPFR